MRKLLSYACTNQKNRNLLRDWLLELGFRPQTFMPSATLIRSSNRCVLIDVEKRVFMTSSWVPMECQDFPTFQQLKEDIVGELLS